MMFFISAMHIPTQINRLGNFNFSKRFVKSLFKRLFFLCTSPAPARFSVFTTCFVVTYFDRFSSDNTINWVMVRTVLVRMENPRIKNMLRKARIPEKVINCGKMRGILNFLTIREVDFKKIPRFIQGKLTKKSAKFSG